MSSFTDWANRGTYRR